MFLIHCLRLKQPSDIIINSQMRFQVVVVVAYIYTVWNIK
jgi:hypothetical protein